MYFIIIAAIITSLLFFYTTTSNKNIHTATLNYPLDDTKQFSLEQTTLAFIGQHDEEEYTLEWKINSEINEKVHIAHDIALLYEDGRLKEIMSITKEAAENLEVDKLVEGEDSGHYEAITFHYRSIDYPNQIKKSVQSMSYDQLYILDSPLSELEYFKKPKNESEVDGKRVLDTIIKQNLEYTWQELIEYFQIPYDKYIPVPLTSLPIYKNEPLPTLSSHDSKELLALAWESIDQYYFSGIEKHNGAIVSPVGSTIPLILFHQTYSHIIIIFQTEDGGKFSIVKNTGRF